jgi:hypothetical protein
LTYASGHQESYPVGLKVGSAFKLIGDEDALKSFKGNELTLLLDADSYPTLQNYPLLWHTGLEWKPIPFIALRYGIDQDALGDGNGKLQVVSDNCYGVGVELNGFNFDYAYHTYAGGSELNNYYFSLAYRVDLQKPGIKKKVEIDSPTDRLITFDEQTIVKGKVIDPTLKQLFLNGRLLSFDQKGEFSCLFNLKVGKNLLKLGGEQIKVLRLITFPDVVIGYWVDKPISLLAMSNIVTGYPDGSFKPEGNITRAEMCTLLIKLSPPEQSRSVGVRFKDVKADNWASEYITRAGKAGIVQGYPDGSFQPQGKITRVEGLAMIVRFARIAESSYDQEFSDVKADYWASPLIAGAYKAGILKYLSNNAFEPKRELTRAETVEMLYRTPNVSDLLNKDLLNWDNYSN